MANYKNYIKSHKYNTYKMPKNQISFNYSKIQKYNSCAHQESICQYVTKKYCVTYLIKKGKYIDYEDLPLKCTSDYKYFSSWINLFTNKN